MIKILLSFLSLVFIFSFNPLMKGEGKESIIPQRSVLEDILEKKELKISVWNDSEPFYIENPKKGYPGFDVEIAMDYADYLGVKLTRIIPKESFEAQQEAIINGEVHIAMSSPSTLARGKKVAFSNPYLFASSAALVSKHIIPPEPEGEIISNNPYTSILDLQYQNGIIFSVRSATSTEQFLRKAFAGKFKIMTFSTDTLALNALKTNQVNCFVTEDLILMGILQKNTSLGVNYKPLLTPVEKNEISIVFRKYDILFLQDLNFFVSKIISSGRVKKLKQKYLTSGDWIKK